MASHVFEIPEGVLTGLRQVCAGPKIALETALATVAAALLHKYSCEGTLAILTVDPRRSGSCVGLLPVKLVVSNDPSFEEMLNRASSVLSNTPSGPEVEILTPPELQHEMKAQNLRLSFRPGTKSLLGTLDYAPGHCAEDTRVAAMVEHFQNLLRELMNAPGAPLSTINMLGNREARRILIEWNDTDCGYPQGSVPELVEQQARRTPHAIALIQGDWKLTYHDLNEQSNRLANYLRRRGVGSEVLVGLCMEQTLDAVVAMLAILKAGGAYVPLDHSYPDRRLGDIVSDSKLAVTITSARCRHRVPDGIETVCMDRDSALIAAQSSENVPTVTTPDSAAYVLYTSASTGQPKGVVGIHRSITNGLMTASYAKDEVCCLNTFLSYGFSIANLFLPLMSGVPVVILSDEQIRDCNQMMTVLQKEGVTRIAVVPSFLKQMVNPDFGAAARLGKITTIGVAGGKVALSHLRRLRELLPGAKLHNRYASTEIGTAAATWPVADDSLIPDGEIPIGRPAANTRIYILDRDLNPVPVGIAGEICVSAAHMARGYLNLPQLTKERFLPDPFSAREGRRLYRTGDLGRFRANGEIELIGRTDHQVKINGFRIDLPEVERTIATHVGVCEVVAAVKEVESGPRLVAYIVPKPVGTPSASQLRRYIRERLPDHMVPSYFVFLEDLPALPNGKVDRSALPLPPPVRPRLETGYQPPNSPMEAAIAQIWTELLKLDPIGIHDNFRDLGGDSLSAAEVAVRLGQRLGQDITPKELLDRPTIAEFAVHLSGPR